MMGGYSVEFFSSYEKKVLWEVVDDHVVEEATAHDEIELRGFDFNFFDRYEKGVDREGSSEYPYLIMLIKLWPGNFNNKLKRINLKVYEDNGKSLVMVNGRYQNVRRFSSNEFWRNIYFLVSAPTFGLGGSRLWEMEEAINISGNNSKRCSIMIKVDFLKVCLSYIIYFILFYFMTILTTLFTSQICGIYLIRGKEFRKYWTKGFESEEDKATGELWRKKFVNQWIQ